MRAFVRVSLVIWAAWVVVSSSAVDVNADDEYAAGWASDTAESDGEKFRRFARQQLSVIEEGEGASDGAGFDLQLLGKLRRVVGGTRGKTGARGAQGSVGDKGPAGPVGPKGPQGPNGGVGPSGPQSKVAGPMGVRGSEGHQGPPGPQGKPGHRGLRGVVGRPGFAGSEGVVGTKKGPRGLRGTTGDRGRTGPQGAPGKPGRRGIPGTKGRRGSPGPPGMVGSSGNPGKGGGVGPRGITGHDGRQGVEGAHGKMGQKGQRGPRGPQGVEGLFGDAGEVGDMGKRGPKGKTGRSGPMGVKGPSGLDGDAGPEGLPGPLGRTGGVGSNGYPGPRGPSGKAGAQGPVGRMGNAGEAGHRGRVGKAGKAGPTGPKGDDFKYEIDGAKQFAVGLGGAKGMMYSDNSGIKLEHSENPTQIRFVQKQSQSGKSTNPAIIAGYFGNLGIGTRTPYKKLHVKDLCTKPDAECADRKGQIMMSASWRNVLMSKIGKTNYDMIGAYTNWAKGRSIIYIGAHDSQARPTTQPVTRVYFGGVPVGKVKPDVRYENDNGKFYAKKFVKKLKAKALSEVSMNADVFLEMAHNADSVDLVDHTVALHGKTSHHNRQLNDLESEIRKLDSIVTGLTKKAAPPS